VVSQPAPLRAIRVDNYPFPALLYLEWVLLGIVLVSQLLPNPFRDTVPLFRGLAFLSTLGLGAMGLRLPQGSMLTKVSYAAVQIGLLLLASCWGGIRGLRLFPLLCVVIVIRNCLIFQITGRLVTSALLYILFLGLLADRLASLSDLRFPLLRQGMARSVIGSFAFNSALLLLLAMIFLLLLMNALVTERQSREQLGQAHEKLRQYALQAEDLAANQERGRIAREIHDSLGHSLTALNLQIEGALKLWPSHPERAQDFLKEAKALGSTALQEVRRSVAAMRADPLQGKSLPEAIQALAQEFQRTTGLQPICQIGLTQGLSPDLNVALYRIVQEALTNICKHAQATQVTIELSQSAHPPAEILLTVQDNGCGFTPTCSPSGFGLQGIRERAAAFGGRLEINSAPAQGCEIIARFPRSKP
jgi:signal transduction histidine kinase